MKSKDISNAVREGIDNSIVGKTIEGIFYACLICIGILFIIYASVFFVNWIGGDSCVEDGTCAVAMSGASCFPLANLHCEVIIWNGTDERVDTYFKVCGYQEANAFYKQLEPGIEILLKKNHPTFKIKYLVCN